MTLHAFPVFLLAVGLRAGLLVVAALAACGLARRAPAAARHSGWCGLFAALFLLPFLMWRGPALALHILPPRATTAAATAAVASRAAVIFTPARPLPATPSRPRPSFVEFVFAVWFLGFLLRTARLVGGLRASARLKPGAVQVPLARGIWCGEILLPAEAESWPSGRREAVLRHETAHLQRRDCLTLALAGLVCALHWFNPLVWLALSRMRHEAENACDDAVLRAGTLPSAYATWLLASASAVGDVPPGAAAMAPGSGIEARLRRVLDPHRNAKALRPAAALLALAAVALALPLAAAHLAARPLQTKFIAPVVVVKPLPPLRQTLAVPAQDLMRRCLECPTPDFDLGWHGTVNVALRVGVDGAVLHSAVVSPSGIPDDVAQQVAVELWHWRFTRAASVVESTVTTTVPVAPHPAASPSSDDSSLVIMLDAAAASADSDQAACFVGNRLGSNETVELALISRDRQMLQIPTTGQLVAVDSFKRNLIQPFTTDRQLLLHSLDRLKSQPPAPPVPPGSAAVPLILTLVGDLNLYSGSMYGGEYIDQSRDLNAPGGYSVLWANTLHCRL